MAGIIGKCQLIRPLIASNLPQYVYYFTAQITRANRKRIENRKFEINSAKCMYEIKPFDQCYDPKVSSK